MNKRYYEHTLSTTREFIEYLRLYGSVDFGEDYREVTGRLAVPEKLYVYVCSFWNTESFKIMEDLIRECVPNNTPPRNGYDT